MILKLKMCATTNTTKQYDLIVPIEKIDCVIEEHCSILINGQIFYITENSYKQVVEAMEAHYTGGY